MAAGRPTDYTPKIVKAAWDYAKGGWIAAGDKVPSVAGLACEIGIHRETCHDLSPDRPLFSNSRSCFCAIALRMSENSLSLSRAQS